MKTKITISSLIILVQTIVGLSQDYAVRFGFVGNSITIGSGLTHPEEECYPSQIAILLKNKYGDTCQIANFAVSGRTMLKQGDFPIWNENSFRQALNYAPDICFIMLGTNDSKPQNWDNFGNQFFSDYQSMLDTFLNRNPATQFILCLPPPAFAIQWGIRDSVIKNNILPLIDSIAHKYNTMLIDFYHPLLDSSYLFPDAIHPNANGAKVMAKMAVNQIIQSDIIHQIDTNRLTFVTSFESNTNKSIRQGDTLVLKWTTVRASQVYLNNQEVNKNGTIKLTPMENTKYVLVAHGPSNSDSLIIFQEVYKPILSKILIFPNKSTIRHGDTIILTARYYDQMKKMMNDTLFNLNWILLNGGGRLIDKTDNQIKFIADSIGKIILRAEYDTIFNETRLTVSPGVKADGKYIKQINIYPNPTHDILNIQLQKPISNKLLISIVSINGKTVYSEELYFYIHAQLKLRLPNLANGIYILKVVVEKEIYQQLITIN